MSCEPLPLGARGCGKTSSPQLGAQRGTEVPGSTGVKDVMGVPPPRGAAGEEEQGHNPRQVIPQPGAPGPSKRNELKDPRMRIREASDTLNCLLKTQLRPCCHESRP